MENCITCNEDGSCQDCLSNYELVDQVCMLKSYPCQDTNCVSCVSEPNMCSLCKPGYYVSEFYGDEVSGTICLEVSE